MHPELFELKALVAGRLDLHRRREIDDHLGSCADCSRHYVAMMLGSSSPKTAEQEARAGHVAASAPPALALAGAAVPSITTAYGIDAPLSPPAPKPAPRVPNTAHALDLDFSSNAPRTPAPVSQKLADAIKELQAATPEPVAAAPAPAPVATAPVLDLSADIIEAPAPTSSFIEPSIFMPTPLGGVSIINPDGSSATISALPERARPVAPIAPEQVPVTPPTPELVVTFSSTPARFKAQRAESPASAAVIEPPSAPAVPLTNEEIEYVSMAVPTSAARPLAEYSFSEAAAARNAAVAAKSSKNMAMITGGVVLVAALGFGGYTAFQSSVSKAAQAAAAAAASQVAKAAAQQPAPVAPAAAAPAPVQTRVVYVERPAKAKKEEEKKEQPAPEPVYQPQPTTVVTIPEVDVGTATPSGALQTNSTRSVTSELTRSARATAMRTGARP